MLGIGELDRSAWLFYARAHLLPKNVGWRREPPDAEILELVGDGPGRLLDAGCGAGRHTIAFAERGWDTVGFDLFSRPLSSARRLAKGTDAHFVQTNATALRRAVTGPFDVVLDVLGPTSDLEHRHLPAYADAVRAVLAPDGRFVIRTFLRREELAPLVARFDERQLVLYPA